MLLHNTYIGSIYVMRHSINKYVRTSDNEASQLDILTKSGGFYDEVCTLEELDV